MLASRKSCGGTQKGKMSKQMLIIPCTGRKTEKEPYEGASFPHAHKSLGDIFEEKEKKMS